MWKCFAIFFIINYKSVNCRNWIFKNRSYLSLGQTDQQKSEVFTSTHTFRLVSILCSYWSQPSFGSCLFAEIYQSLFTPCMSLDMSRPFGLQLLADNTWGLSNTARHLPVRVGTAPCVLPELKSRRRHTVASASSGEQNSNLPPVNTGDKKKALVGHLMPCRAKRPPKTPQQVAIFSESSVSTSEVERD